MGNQWHIIFHPWATYQYIGCRLLWMITGTTELPGLAIYFSISAKHHGKLPCTCVLRVCIGYFVVLVNRSKFDFDYLTQMWRTISVCNEFTFSVAQYLLAMFCFHPASTISTQHPLLCCEISTQRPDPFHSASRRKIGLWYLTFGSRPRLHSSHISVYLKFWSLY